MKRALWISFLLISVGLLAHSTIAPVAVFAQSCCGLSTSAAQALKAMFSTGSYVAPSVTPGTTTVTGCQNRVIYGDNSSILNCEAALGYTASTDTVATTAGTGSGLWEFSGQTNISGPDATTNVEIGSTANDANAGTGGTSVVIGNGATNTINGTGVVAIGSLAAVTTTSGVDSIAIGRAATVNSANGQAIGAGSSAGNAALAIGSSATAASTSVSLGNGSVAATGQFVSGSGSMNIANVFFGEGQSNTTASAYAVNGTAGSGTDNAGGGLNVAGGRPTGTARGGNVVLQAAPSGATSSTLQTLEDRHYVVAQRFTLTDNTIATFTAMALGDDTVGGGTVSYCVVSRDATTSASECGEVDFGGLDVTAGAGGEVCPTPTKQGTPLQILSGATLAVTFAAATGTDLCSIRVTADTNIAAPVALYIVWNASNPGGRTLTPQ